MSAFCEGLLAREERKECGVLWEQLRSWCLLLEDAGDYVFAVGN